MVCQAKEQGREDYTYPKSGTPPRFRRNAWPDDTSRHVGSEQNPGSLTQLARTMTVAASKRLEPELLNGTFAKS
jgi:hypothetical protein